MNIKKGVASLAVGLVAVALGLSPGALAFAESGEGGIHVGADLQTHLEGGDREGVSAEATTSTDVQESDTEGMDSESSHRQSETSAMREEDSQHSSDEQGKNKNEKDNENADTEIEIDHEGALQATTTVENSDEVHNHGELRSFLNHLVKADDHIADVQVSSTTVDANYSLPANFLWAIPTHIPAQISVGTNGSVTITYPWYAFLFATHDDALKSQLGQAASSTASTTFSASVQAHLLNSIFSILRGD